MTTYTDREIDRAIVDYAIHHDVETDAVVIDVREEGGAVVGFRLSLDVGGRSRGCDETFGEWK